MNVVRFNQDTYKNCVVSEDFYKAINLISKIKDESICSVYQMKINPKTYREVEVQMWTWLSWSKAQGSAF